MQQDFRPIPHKVAHALATLAAPSGREEFIRVYGEERGAYEWSGTPQAEAEERRRNLAEATVEQAKAIAEQNGWAWADIQAAAREDHPRLFNA